MNNLITKELLSEVLGEKVVEVRGTLNHIDNQRLLSYIISYNDIDAAKKMVNIDSLTRIMIEYITDLDYNMDIDCDGKYNIELIGYCEDSDEFGCLKLRTKSFNTLLEPMVEAVTWILENK